MSVRTPQLGQTQTRLYDVLRAGFAARPPTTSPVYTSGGTLIGYAEKCPDANMFVFTNPQSLRGVRVHPPFRVECREETGIVSSVTEILSGALSR